MHRMFYVPTLLILAVLSFIGCCILMALSITPLQSEAQQLEGYLLLSGSVALACLAGLMLQGAFEVHQGIKRELAANLRFTQRHMPKGPTRL